MSGEPLHQMNPTRRFSGVVDDYVRFRPDYPQAGIDLVLEGMGYPGMLTVADVGAGTGIFARQLAQRGSLVVAVEPNEDMLSACPPHDRILPQVGRAEATGLRDSSVDLVTCAQAFHWFEPEAALREFHRILRGLGRLAILWNTRDADDPLTAGYTAAIRKASDNHPAESCMDEARGFEESALFINVREHRVPHQQHVSLEGLIGRARSASYCPTAGPRLTTLIAELTTLHAHHADAQGNVCMRYVTRIFLADPAPRS